jgi:histidinol-phosphate aminotransferase
LSAANPGRLAVPAVRGLSPYVPGKPITELERELGIHDIIKLASNENPYGPSPSVRAALQGAIDDVWLYPDGSCYELKQALAQHLKVDPACITVGNGSNDLLMLLAEGFLDANSHAVHSQYGFAIYPLVIRETGARAIEVPALAASSAMPLGHDLDAMLAAITPQTRLVYIANPNNPTGTWAETAQLKRFIERASAETPHTLIVLDEAYFEYGRQRGTQDGIGWLAQHPNLVITRTFSKAYALAGVRVGYAVSHPEVAEVLNRVRPPFNVNSLAQVAAIAALADQAYMRQVTGDTMRELTRVEARIKQLGIWIAPSATNFVLARFGVPALQVYQQLLHEGVIVRPIGAAGLPDALRISMGTAAQNDRLLQALPRVLKALRAPAPHA